MEIPYFFFFDPTECVARDTAVVAMRIGRSIFFVLIPSALRLSAGSSATRAIISA
jgi:hypothetical protein